MTSMALPSVFRVALLDEDPASVASVRWILDGTPGTTLISTAFSPEEAIRRFPGTAPQIILTDILFRGRLEISIVDHLRRSVPTTAVVVLTRDAEPAAIRSCILAGAQGILLKKDPPLCLVDSLRTVHAGGLPVSPFLTRKLIPGLQAQPPGGTKGMASNSVDRLSPRERQLFEALVRGARYVDIAGQMGISVETVRTHLRRACSKLEAGGKSEAIAVYARCEATRAVQDRVSGVTISKSSDPAHSRHVSPRRRSNSNWVESR